MADGEYRRLRPACIAPECERPAAGRGMCSTHYCRWWKTGSMDAPAPRIPSPCNVAGCVDVAKRKGLCNKHYCRATYKPIPRVKRPPPEPKPRVRAVQLPCAVDACEGKAHSPAGLCPSHWHRLQRFGDALAEPPCAYCGEPVLRQTDSMVYCSHRCVKRHKAGLPDKVPCVTCGEMFRVTEGAVACSERCNEARRTQTLRAWVEKRKQDPEYHARRRIAQQRRRARMLGLGVEEFTFTEIAERDKWRCGLCMLKVNPDLKHPHPMSGSIDHIVPVSKGGAHVRTNVQIAHLF